jgi:hypothetical protein
MPMPLSSTLSVRAAGSSSMRIRSSLSWTESSGRVRASKRSRSSASLAFEISSRRKISFLVERVDHQAEQLLHLAWKGRVSLRGAGLDLDPVFMARSRALEGARLGPEGAHFVRAVSMRW